jgi:hypothetical protein
VVRVVHRWFASGDEWDDQFEGHTHGWVAFFRILKLYLAHFAGETGSGFQLMGTAPEPASAAWEALAGALGLAGATEGQRVVAATGAPPLAGTVAHTGPAGHTEMLLRIDRPASGIVHLFALPMGGKVYLPVRFYLYGAGAADAVARHEESWRAWMNGRFGGA